jgi:methyl-accepting chemotaxis protein
MSIRIRILLVTMLVILIITGTLITTSYLSQHAAEKRFIEAALSGKSTLMDQLVARHTSQMAAFTKALTRDRVTLKALRSGDRKVLQEQVVTTHNLFYSDGTLDRLQITDPEGRYLASAPEPMTGITAKSVVAKAGSEASITSGISLDDDGELQAVLAFPLYARGKLKGIAVYSRNLQRVVDDFQSDDASDVFLLDTKGAVKHMAKDNQLEAIDTDHLPVKTGGLEVIRSDGTYRVVTRILLTNVRGETVGSLVTSQDQTQTYSMQETAQLTSIAVVLIAILGSWAGLFWYFQRTFRPIEDVIGAMSEIATGNLACEVVSQERNDETGRLARAMCAMVNQLRDLLRDITTSVDRLTSAGGELAEITEASSKSIVVQHTETDHVATAINEMTATVQEVAKNAADAAQAAIQANARATEGQNIVQKTIASIVALADDIERAGAVVSRLKSESENIGAVLDVIRGISEQTNLLALNAAIEAARAGEQGRGFAVVADEVRTLASRTQRSTQEIQQMISGLQEGAGEAVQVMETSQTSSVSTVELAQQADRALSAINQSVNQINDMNTQIAAAADQQHSVAEMINGNVVNIAHLAEESRKRTEKTSMASDELCQLAEHLRGMVHRFTL